MPDLSLEILLKVLSDTVGADKAAEVLAKVKAEAGTGAETFAKLGDETRSLGQDQESAAGHAEHLHISHRAIHQILHLIAHQSGPAAGAVIAGVVGAASGGGAMAGVMVIKQLAEAFKQVAEEAEKAQDKIREMVGEQASLWEGAYKSVNQTREDIDKFFTDLDTKIASQTGKQAFKDWVGSFKAVGDAAVAAGLASKPAADKFIDQHTQQSEKDRVSAIDSSIEFFTGELKKLEQKLTGSGGMAQQHEVDALNKDLDALRTAMESRKEFEPTSETVAQAMKDANIGNGSKVDFGNNAPSAVAATGDTFDYLEVVIMNGMKLTDALKKQKEKVAELEAKISELVTEKSGLTTDINHRDVDDTAKDFVTAKAYADAMEKGGTLTNKQQQFLMVVEQAITGKAVNLQQSMQLIEMQSKNDEAMLLMLNSHREKITSFQSRLDALERSQ